MENDNIETNQKETFESQTASNKNSDHHQNNTTKSTVDTTEVLNEDEKIIVTMEFRWMYHY